MLELPRLDEWLLTQLVDDRLPHRVAASFLVGASLLLSLDAGLVSTNGSGALPYSYENGSHGCQSGQ